MNNFFYNLKIAIRNLRRNGLYSAINIGGLAVSMAVCVFILLWVQDEKSYDCFHHDADNIYMAVAHFKTDGGTNAGNTAPGLFAPTALQQFAEVTDFCRLREASVGYVQSEDIKTDRKQLLVVDSSFFTFFNFPIMAGERKGLLQNPNETCISKSLSAELFGDKDPLGRIIKMDGGKEYQVVAVMDDFPENTYLPHADMLCLHHLDPDPFYWEEIIGTWGSCEFLSFLRVSPGTDTDHLAGQITAQQPVSGDTRFFTLVPLVEMHLYTLAGEPAGIKTVWLFQWIVFIILFIACINYINLVTARASKRQSEVGLRKILGARKGTLFTQLMTEALILFVVAGMASVMLNILLLPGYHQLSGNTINWSWLNGNVWSIYGWMLLLLVMLAGAYPAWLLASFHPLRLIKGKKRENLFRRVLVIFQFTASASLIIATIVLELQMDYIHKKELGFDKEQLFTCNLPGNAIEHFEAIKAGLLQDPAILEVTGAGNDIGGATETNPRGTFARRTMLRWDGKVGEGTVSHTQMSIDSTFLNVMRIPLIEGQGFTGGSREQFIINETAAKVMGLQEPRIGKWIYISNGMRGMIVGIVKDFHFASLHYDITPMILDQTPASRVLYVRTTAQNAGKAVAAVEKIWKQHHTDYTFHYQFLDDAFDQLYRSDTRAGNLFISFALIAILISCLGLFGLVTYTAETKTKEIGIRKVLGASVAGIVELLSKEFLILVGIAMLIAFPLAYYWLNKMLQDYAYRINLSWWMFAIAGVITLVLTLLTVGWQAIKAATANPVKSLKTE